MQLYPCHPEHSPEVMQQRSSQSVLFPSSQLAAERQQKEMGGDGERREVQEPSSQGEVPVWRMLGVRPICTCAIDIMGVHVQGLRHPYLDISLRQKRPGSGPAACPGRPRALCHRRVLQVLLGAAP